jgi:hypothetical protein
MSAARGDDGFVMMDALVGVAILGLVGTGALMLANGLLAAQDRQLDRSVALLMSELLATQYAAFGPNPSSSPSTDGMFDYEVVASGIARAGSRLTPMIVVVRERGRKNEVLRLDFLAGPS